jgi:GDP/UDP-N,N'-diacetylbacillosamine 2-epimerase (hydrolysing)
VKICVVTGTRAEYGIFRSVLQAIEKQPGLTLQLAVTGMHLLRKFGNTVDDIRADGWRIDAQVPMYRDGDSPAAALARGIAGFDKAFATLRPDVVMVLGDRLEILAAAAAALARQIPIAHLHGGETAPGQFDEQIRHAVTKMGALHFVATTTSAARVRQMGEASQRIFVVGAPALDHAVTCAAEWRKTKKRGAITPLLALHPSSADDAVEQRRAELLIDCIRAAFPGGGRIAAVGPNNDPGHAGILAAYRARAGDLDLTMSLPQEAFWKKLSECGLLIGNSSSGIIEAASLGAIAVNVGDRQWGRERSQNVIDVPWVRGRIIAALERALSDKAFQKTVQRCKNVYGKGGSGARIAKLLSHVEIEALRAPKRFVDLPQVR